MADEAFLRVHLKNQRPVELLDLTASLMALGQSYEDFAAAQGVDPIKGNVRLYIRELQGGSIIADLHALLDQTSFVIEHREVFALFLSNFDELVRFFLAASPPAGESGPSRVQAERVSRVFEPVAKDSASQLILQVGDVGELHVHQYTYNSEQANTVQNKARKYLGSELPRSQHFEHEPMTLFQVRDDPRGRVGDRGIIETFSSKPVKLYFASEAAKRAVLEHPDNPLHRIFFVDGQASCSGDTVVQYKIYYVHGSIDKSEA